MMWLNEWVFKLTCFFVIGYVFILLDILFLSLTEDFPLKKTSFNIVNYFPLSYGIFLPILTFFLSHPYYPAGSPRYRDFPFHFEIEHTSNKLFSYLILMGLFLVSLEFSLLQYQEYSYIVLSYLWWFYQVFFVFLVFQLIPLYPTLMGIGLLKEVKRYLVRHGKISQLPKMLLLAELSSYFFIFFTVSLNYTTFDEQLQQFVLWLLRNLNTGLYFTLLGVISIFVFGLFYVKKREYNRYLEYIKNILKDAFLKEKDPS